MKTVLVILYAFSFTIAYCQEINKEKFLRAVLQNPTDSNFYRSVGYIKAMKFSSLALKTHSKDDISNLLVARGIMKYELGDLRGAIVDLDNSVKTASTEWRWLFSAYVLKGSYLYKLGKKDEACYAWSKAGEITPSEEVYHQIRVYCSFSLDKEIDD